MPVEEPTIEPSPAALAAKVEVITDPKQVWVYTDDAGRFIGLWRSPLEFERVNVRHNWTMTWVDFKTLAVEDFPIGPHYRITVKMATETLVYHLAQRIIWEAYPA
jgi:hypothetical protein